MKKLDKKYLCCIMMILFLPTQSHAEEKQKKFLTASWYSVESLKNEGTWKTSKGIMANGQKFANNLFVCASWDYPLNTMLLVRSVKTGKAITVKVTDRTSKRFAGKRIDLSRSAFSVLSPLAAGLVKVEVHEL